MASVELAKALSDKLGVPLDETLLWNFATIDELITHLDAEAHVNRPPASVAPATAGEEDLGAKLDDEIARLELELKRR
jgi:hypothetical protein